MILFPWRKLAQLLRQNSGTSHLQRVASTPRFFRWLWLEQLEDRTLLSTYQWVGGDPATPTSWSDQNNWYNTTATVPGLGQGYPTAVGDIAQFVDSVPGGIVNPTATVDAAGINVGEIDFGSVQTITINNSGGGNILTLSSGTANPAILNTLAANTGTDSISAPVTQAASLNVTANGGSLTVASLALGAAATDTVTGTSAFSIGALTLHGADTLSVSNTAGTSITGNIGNTAGTDTLTIAGSGTLNLPNTNTDTNTTILADTGTVNVGTSTSLGSGGVTLTSGTLAASAAGVTLGNTLTFSPGGAQTIGGTNAIALSATIILNGSDTLTANDTGGTTFTGAIGNTASSDTLTVAGNSTLTLSPANSTNVNTVILAAGPGGTLVLPTANSLGTTALLTLTSGTLQTAAVVSTLPNNITFTSGGSATLSNASPLTIGGTGVTITLNGTNTLTLSGQNVTIAPSTTFAGTGTLLFAGAGTVSIPGAITNSNAIGTSGATLVLGSTGSLGGASGTLAVDGGTITSTPPLTLAGGVQFLGGTTTFSFQNNLTINGTGTATGTSTIVVNNTLTLNGVISGPGGIVQQGSGTVVLAPTANNTFTGGYILNTTASPGASASAELSGVLVLGNNHHPRGTGTVTLSTGALQASTNVTLPNNVVLNQVVTIQGASNITFSGAFSLASASIALTVNNPVTTVAGVITGAAANNLVLAGTGQLVLTAANTYAGNTIINGGTLTLNSTGAINPAALASITVNSGGALTLDNTTTAVSGRLNSNITLNLQGGNFTLTGNSAGVAESIGLVNLTGGQSVFTTNPNGGTLSFTATMLVRSPGATVNFNGTGLGGASNHVIFTTAPTATNGILPYGIVNNNDFATYSNGTNIGIGAPQVAGFYATTLVGATATSNVKLTANDVVQGAAQTVNSLLIVGNNITVGGTGALTLGSGGLAVNGTGDTISAPISQAAIEGIVTTSAGLNLTGGFSATTGGALTLSGSGTVVVNNTNITGTFFTSINNVTAALGSVTGATLSSLGTLNLVGGTLAVSPQASTATNGLNSRFVTLPDQHNTGTQYDFANLPLQTGVPPTTTPNINFTNPSSPALFFAGQPGATPGTQFGVRWTGMINITQAGPTTFTTSSDDASRLYIDGVLVVDNDNGHGVQAISNTINLSAGLHDLVMYYDQGAGGDQAILSYTPFGGVSQVIPTNVLYTSDALLTALPNAINVTGNSGIQVLGGAFTTVGFGSLTVNAGGTLNVAGQTGKKVTFGSTTLLSTGAVNFNDAPNLTLGTVTGAAIVNLAKQGAGQLFLDNTSAATPNSLVAGSNLDVYAGKATAIGSMTPLASNPLSNLAVTVDGGTLSLDSKGGIPPNGVMTFNNPITVATSGTVEALSDNIVYTIGSAANGINILNGQTLTLNAYAGDYGTINGGFAGANLTIPGVIAGNGNLNVIGTYTGTYFVNPGIVTLNGANTFTGTTTIAGSNVVLGNASALGTSTSAITIGDPNGLLATALLANVAFSTSRNINVVATVPSGTVGNTTTAAVTIGNNANVAVTFSGNVTANVPITLNAFAGSTVTFAGNLNLGLGGQTIVGGGTVAESGTNTYTGATTISTGTLLASSTTAIPTNSQVADAGTLNINNNTDTIGSLAGTGTVNLGTGTLSVGGLNTTTTFSGTLSATAGSLIKTGSGTLNLTGPTVSYTGATLVNGGILAVNGTLTGTSSVTVASGATLELNPTTAGVNYAMPLTLNGIGLNGIGALVNVTSLAANFPTWSGPITLNSGAGNAVAIGSLTATNNLLLTGVVSGASDLVKVGPGRIDLQNADSYGNTIINGGTLALSGASGAVTTTSFTVNTGGTLLLDDTAFTLTNRAGTTPITLNGGSLTLTGNGFAANSDTVGAVTLNDGNSTIAATTSTDTLNLTSLSRTSGSGATVGFPGSGAVNINNAGSLPVVGGILPYATVGSGAALAMAAFLGNTVVPVSGTVNTLTAGANVVLTANTAVTAPVAINSLNLNGFSLTGSFLLTVTSGIVMNSATTGTASIDAPLAFGTAEGILTTNAQVPPRRSTVGSLSGSGGLTISGAGTLNLNTPNSYTGTTTLDGGTLVLGTPGALSTGTLALIGGTLQSTVALTLGNAFTLNNSNVTFAGSSPITFTGNGTLANSSDDNPNNVTVNNLGGVFFTGNLSDGRDPWQPDPQLAPAPWP